MNKVMKHIPEELKLKVCSIFDNKCYFCGEDLIQHEDYGKEFHHYIPEVCGGKTEESNIVLSCCDCHKKIHSNLKISYGQLRRTLYFLFCEMLDILPVSQGWDDDLYSSLKANPQELGEDWKTLQFCMKFIDVKIGNIKINLD